MNLAHLTSLTPDNYRDDAYLWCCNQWAHFTLGLITALLVSVSFYLIAGEFPIRWHVWVGITAFYVIVIEIIWQRNWTWDALEDTIFTCVYGAGAPLYSFREITPTSPKLTVDVEPLTVAALYFLTHTAYGALIRWVRTR